MIDYTNLNKEIDGWKNKVVANINSTAPVLSQIKARTKQKYGAPIRIGFSFPKHYVFREKGVGKGRKIGSGKETPKPVINPAILEALPELGEIAANGFAEVVVRNLFIK
jgi:hypothetical protein